MNLLEIKKIVLIRLDRIGDLVLTLPVDQHPALEHVQVVWCVPQSTEFVLRQSAPPRSFFPLSTSEAFKAFRKLLAKLRKIKPDAAVVFHGPWWVGFALYLSRVRLRAGVRSQWHSFFFFNRSIRQKRSHSIKHEFDYNWELLNFCLNGEALASAPSPSFGPSLKLEVGKLEKLPLELPSSYYVVHPGMGGSARNWPPAKYIELIQILTEKNSVVVTGTLSDEPYLRPIFEGLRENKKIFWTQGKLNGEQLLAVLARARGVVAPSTGIVHLAASLAVPTVGIYSPVKVQAPLRWGPRGEKVTVHLPTFLPGVSCPGHMSCLMEKCELFDCMERIEVTSVIHSLEALEHGKI